MDNAKVDIRDATIDDILRHLRQQGSDVLILQFGPPNENGDRSMNMTGTVPESDGRALLVWAAVSVAPVFEPWADEAVKQALAAQTREHTDK